jgi:glycerol-3-phosphate dehydrogenase
VDAAVAELGGGRRRSPTASLVLPHADIADVEGRLLETLRELGASLDRDQIEHLGGWYGTEASEVVRYAVTRQLLHRLAPGAAVLAGEIVYAVEYAQARRLGDAVLRRTPLGSAGDPGSDALEAAADLMAERLGWPADRRASEIADVRRRYPASMASPPARPAVTAR